MAEMTTPWIMIESIVVVQLIGLFFSVLADPYLQKEQKRVMIAITVIVSALFVQNNIEYYLNNHIQRSIFRICSSAFGYMVRPVIIVLFMELINVKKGIQIAWSLVYVNMFVYMTAFFSGLTFAIDEKNQFHRGPLGHTCLLLSAVLLFWNVVQAVTKYREIRKRDMLIPIFNTVIVVIAVCVDINSTSDGPLTWLTLSIVNSCVYYYIWLHLQFVRENERALMAEQRIQIMMSQIQPHFLFNTLSTIQALCRTDPDKAFETLEFFGAYLRDNIDILEKADMVSFKKELEHTKAYTQIESVRFPNIEIEYHIETTDFQLPPLTLQPIVENAIRHGVRIRKDGKVDIYVKKTEKDIVIKVMDNGKGFDFGEIENVTDIKRSHIGIKNVRDRIEKMCNGNMEISSKVGEGTKVTIHIPV